MKINKTWFLALILTVGMLQTVSAETENPGKIESLEPQTLQESYHRFESLYQVSRLQSLQNNEKSTLQSLVLMGDVVLTPQVSLLLDLPMVTFNGSAALTNPFLGAKVSLFDGLVKDFPTFVNFKGGVKFPLASSQEFVFNRTDVLFSFQSLREIHHLSLKTDAAYTVKIDPENDKTYGNAWSFKVGGELNTGYQFSPGFMLNYRWAGRHQDQGVEYASRSAMILQPTFSYTPGADTLLQGSFAFPLSRQNLKDTLRVFGDYTIAGIGGPTFYLSFEKKF